VLAQYRINICKSSLFYLYHDYHTPQINGAMVDIARIYRGFAVTGVTLPRGDLGRPVSGAEPEAFPDRVMSYSVAPLAGFAGAAFARALSLGPW
jgi:hypothetical protein